MNPLLPSLPASEDFTASALVEAVTRLGQKHHSTPFAIAPLVRLGITAISLEEDAFNVRAGHLDAYHLGQLSRSLAAVADLAPILVLPCGDQLFLVDGHHRLAAYRLAGRSDIPVEVFAGTVREAVLEATLRNTAATLQMDNRGRQDCGWRLVNANFTLKEIVAAAGISRAQASVMRKIRKALGDDAAMYSEWWAAKRAAAGRPTEPLTDDEVEAMKAAHAQTLADGVRRGTGNKLAANPEIGAMALVLVLGRKLPEMVRWLKHHLSPADLQYMEDEENWDF